MKKDRKFAWVLNVFLLGICLEACGSGEASAVTGRDFLNSQTSIFRDLSIVDGEAVTADFTVDLSETEAGFLFVEVSEDMEGTMHYTYSNGGREGLVMGYCAGDAAAEEIALEAATEEAYGAIWTDTEVSLKKGTNVFFVSGEDQSCRMQFELTGLDKEKVTYVSAFSREQAINRINGQKDIVQ